MRPVQVSILRESADELLEQARFFRVVEALQNRPQRVDFRLDRLFRLLGFASKCDRRLVGVRHHGPVRSVGGLGELNEKIRGQPTRL